MRALSGLLVGLTLCTTAGVRTRVETLTLAPDTLALASSDQSTLTATCFNQFADPIVCQGGVSWKVRDESKVARISTSQAFVDILAKTTGTTWVVAKAGSGRGIDSTKVVVLTAPPAPIPPTPAPTLVAVVLTPDTVTVVVNATTNFTTQGRLSTGQMVPVTASYSSTGGSTTSGGIYTAGATPGTYREIASASGFADTSVIIVTGTAPTLASITMTPDSVSVAGGATQQFVVVGHLSNGSPTTVSPVYVATGGVISAGGLYTAGSTAGTTFRAIATAGGFADTSKIVVTTAPPPPPPPPPPSVAAGCPSSGYLRLVNVSTKAALTAALSGAIPGDQIRLAAGTYVGAADYGKAGTAANRITICGVNGVWPIMKGGRFKITGSFTTITGVVFEGPNGNDVNVFISTPTHDLLFTHNIVRNSDWHAGLSCEHSYNTTISYNLFSNNGGVSGEIDHGIYYRTQATTSTTRNYVLNNVIVGSVGRGISMHDNGGNPISYTTVANNTIARNGSTGVLLALEAGTGNIIVNNVIADNGLTYNYKQIRWKSGTGNSILNNITWSPTPAKNGTESLGSNTVSGNLSVNPLFVAGTSDWHLQAGSPAIGLANPTYSVSPDFDGNARDGSPDAGAYER